MAVSRNCALVFNISLGTLSGPGAFFDLSNFTASIVSWIDIGLSKSLQMSSVFSRFVDFSLNEIWPDGSEERSGCECNNYNNYCLKCVKRSSTGISWLPVGQVSPFFTDSRYVQNFLLALFLDSSFICELRSCAFLYLISFLKFFSYFGVLLS